MRCANIGLFSIRRTDNMHGISQTLQILRIPPAVPTVRGGKVGDVHRGEKKTVAGIINVFEFVSLSC